MNTQTTCKRCGKAVGTNDWDIHTCTPPVLNLAATPISGWGQQSVGLSTDAQKTRLCDDCETVSHCLKHGCVPKQPAQSLPFGVGGGLVAIKTLLSRDPCAHATVAIQMIDAILAEQPAQPQQEPVACPTCGEYEPRTGTCGASPNDKRALCNRRDQPPPAQPQQEPVAWVCYGAPGKRDIDFEEADINGLPIGTLLYTSPPARKPLTDEEIRNIWSNGDCFEEIAFARAIETAHGIKGDA